LLQPAQQSAGAAGAGAGVGAGAGAGAGHFPQYGIPPLFTNPFCNMLLLVRGHGALVFFSSKIDPPLQGFLCNQYRRDIPGAISFREQQPSLVPEHFCSQHTSLRYLQQLSE